MARETLIGNLLEDTITLDMRAFMVPGGDLTTAIIGVSFLFPVTTVFDMKRLGRKK